MATNRWNATLYDDKMSFVSGYGRGVIELLQPKPGEQILDLGCGTGDLTEQIARSGAAVTGVDLSESMIAKAKEKFPDLDFSVGDAETFRSACQFDAIFSNAALHWMKRPELVVQSIALALKPGGRLVAEFGGKGNVQAIVEGISAVLNENGFDANERNPWYFPSLGEYTSLLERAGFRVVYAIHFDRPTPLADGEAGLAQWFATFCEPFFAGMSQEVKEALAEKAIARIKPSLYSGSEWIADYKRLRVVAVKQ